MTDFEKLNPPRKDGYPKVKELKAVVNCFQNCILAYNSQPDDISLDLMASCELLSKLYFSL